MKTKEELNTLKDENQALSANELTQVTGGVINIKDKEDISGGMSGTSGYLVVGGGGQSAERVRCISQTTRTVLRRRKTPRSASDFNSLLRMLFNNKK